jgi:hypothetical protein
MMRCRLKKIEIDQISSQTNSATYIIYSCVRITSDLIASDDAFNLIIRQQEKKIASGVSS